MRKEYDALSASGHPNLTIDHRSAVGPGAASFRVRGRVGDLHLSRTHFNIVDSGREGRSRYSFHVPVALRFRRRVVQDHHTILVGDVGSSGKVRSSRLWHRRELQLRQARSCFPIEVDIL